MTIWKKLTGNKHLFLHGQESYSIARIQAQQCTDFSPDDENEAVCEDKTTCYNCRYRRWTPDSFECVKPADHQLQ